jgi:hypothetical protein
MFCVQGIVIARGCGGKMFCMRDCDCKGLWWQDVLRARFCDCKGLERFRGPQNCCPELSADGYPSLTHTHTHAHTHTQTLTHTAPYTKARQRT